MNSQNDENLKELFERFVGADQAQSAVEDFAAAQRILCEHPVPGPDEELIAGIKSEIAETMRLRKERAFRRMAYKLAPVAAVFIVLALVSIKMYVGNGGPEKIVYARMIPSAVWDSENVAVDDVELAILTAQIDELEGEVVTLELGEDSGNGRSAVTELEMELAEINSDFWEG
ncbi:MAG TPA: hypothetical protein VMY06_12395 [Sedimentisphaerales bacterium]|nr:hypothetical protein [Sedimentisphaerales bacterium]